MSDGVETRPDGRGGTTTLPPAAGWGGRRMLWLILLASAAHVALIFIFGSKKLPVPRAVIQVPHFRLAPASELIALSDPTLFALPHVEDFAPAIWRRVPDIAPPSFRWTESPPFLDPPLETLGATFSTFMQSNRFAGFQLSFKPEPKVAGVVVPAISVLPQTSSVTVAGELARRPLLEPILVPTLATNDVIAPSRVQLLVDAAGNVVSTVLLDSSEYPDANNVALALSRKARFARADRLMLGELIFHWHTVPAPMTTTNAP